MADSEMINLGDVCRSQLGMQCQYGSRYADRRWHPEYQYCGDGLRITGDSGNYHSMTIHRDDAAMFVERVKGAQHYR